MYDNYDAAYAAASAGVMLVYSIFVLVIAVLTLVAMWKIFVKEIGRASCRETV